MLFAIPKYCRKRDGSIAKFDKKMITNAIVKAFQESNEGNPFLAQKITEKVVDELTRLYPNSIPTIEEIQDIVEFSLIEYDFRLTAKKYILYRNERMLKRA